jgi:ComF family protein
VYKKLLFVHQDCAKLSNIDGVFAAIKYNKAAKEFLQLIKYSGYYTLIDVLIDQCLYSFANLPIAYDYVVPIPLHQSRRRWRGFNQAEVMAAKLTRNYRDILSRVRNTKAQAHLTKEQRLTNAQNAFSVGPSNLNPDLRIKGKTILLIDDVFTTGATSENCALVLKSHGAKKVYLYTWARGDG